MNDISSREALFNKNMPKKQRQQPDNQRVLRFADWMDKTDAKWYTPDLEPFVKYLANLNVSREEIEAHLKAIYMTYAKVIEDKHLLISGVASSMTNNKEEWTHKIEEIKTTLKAFSKQNTADIDIDGIVEAVALSKVRKPKTKITITERKADGSDNKPATIPVITGSDSHHVNLTIDDVVESDEVQESIEETATTIETKKTK